MTEPDVTLTDFGLALECALFIVLLQRGPAGKGSLRSWYTLFFTSMGAASLLGGTVHGFFLDETRPGAVLLWQLTLLAMGVTTLSLWAIGGTLLFSQRVFRWVLAAAALQLVAYGVIVLFVTQEFWVGVADSLPAVLFLLVALLVLYARQRRGILLLAAVGPALTLVASLLQYLRIGVHPHYFNHNAFFHVLQAIALLLFFLGGRWLIGKDRGGDDELLGAS